MLFRASSLILILERGRSVNEVEHPEKDHKVCSEGQVEDARLDVDPRDHLFHWGQPQADVGTCAQRDRQKKKDEGKVEGEELRPESFPDNISLLLERVQLFLVYVIVIVCV